MKLNIFFLSIVTLVFTIILFSCSADDSDVDVELKIIVSNDTIDNFSGYYIIDDNQSVDIKTEHTSLITYSSNTVIFEKKLHNLVTLYVSATATDGDAIDIFVYKDEEKVKEQTCTSYSETEPITCKLEYKYDDDDDDSSSSSSNTTTTTTTTK